MFMQNYKPFNEKSKRALYEWMFEKVYKKVVQKINKKKINNNFELN